MSDSPWAPIHHESADSEPAAKPRAAAKPKPEDKQVPMALSLAIPADFIATMSAVAGALSEVASAMADNTKAMKELVAEMKKQSSGGG
jgi:hypothetical protein